MRASATSRTASPAVFPSPQAKSDAGKADDTSPFAILLNEVVAKPAALQKDSQNKDSQGSNENTNSGAASQSSGTDAGAQATSQAAVTPPKPDKASDKGAKNSGEKGGDNSASSPSAAGLQQPNVQTPVPAAARQISIMAATTNGAAARNAVDQNALADPTGAAASGQNNAQTNAPANAPANTPPSQTGSSSQNTLTAGQPPGTQAQAPGPAGSIPQPDVTQSPVLQSANPPAQVPGPAGSIPQPDVTQSSVRQSANPPAQTPISPQNIVLPNPPQPAPLQPSPNQTQLVGTVQHSVQPDASQPQASPPKGPKSQHSVAQNTVQPNADQLPAVLASAPQVQTPATQNTVQSNTAPLPAVLPGIPHMQAATKPAKTDKSDDKATKNAADKGDGDSAASSTATGQTQVQPDASLISTATTSAPPTVQAVTPADDDAGEDASDVQATSAATNAASGPAKAQGPQDTQGLQDTKNLQAALAARQAYAPQGPSQTAPSQSGVHPDSAKTHNSGANQSPQSQLGAGLPIKPWQAKPQNLSGDVTANSGQTSNANPDDVKQAAAPAPQIAANNTMPIAKPADPGNSNLPVLPGAAPQSQQGQASPATAIIQNLQVSTSAPNMLALAVEIAARSQSGAKQFDIRLDPPDLGRVEIRLSIDATGKASAHVSAEQPQTLDLLQKDAPTLTRALRDAGLNVAQNGLNFSLRQQQGDAGASGNQNRAGNGRSFTLAAVSSIDASAAGATYRGPADGRLDIRV